MNMEGDRVATFETSGELQNIKTRVGLGNFVGITDKNRARGYTVRLLNKGMLEERLVSKTGRVPEYEYHLKYHLKQASSPYAQKTKVFSQDHGDNAINSSAYSIKVEYAWGSVDIKSADKDGIIEIIKALRE